MAKCYDDLAVDPMVLIRETSPFACKVCGSRSLMLVCAVPGEWLVHVLTGTESCRCRGW